MARPNKSENLNPVRNRIEEEFWKLLKKESLSHITVSALVKNAGCNRTTFYYYFDSVEDLAWKIIAENLPMELPKIAQAYFNGEVEAVAVNQETLRMIERLSILIGKDGSSHLAALVEESLKNMWIEAFRLRDIKNDDEVAYMLEFMAGGVISLVSRHGSPPDMITLKKCMLLMNTVFTKPALEFIVSRQMN